MDINSMDMSAILNSSPNPTFIKDENLHFIFVNTAYENMFNVKMKDVVGKTVLELEYLPENDRLFYQEEDREMLEHGKTRHHVFNYLYRGKDVHACLYWTSGFVQKNGKRGLIGVIVDINRQSKKLQQLRKQLDASVLEKKALVEKSGMDALTHLYTRGIFDDALQRLSSSSKNTFSCIMVDIDRFKAVNDTFGHVIGDTVIQAVAAVLKKCARKRDMACRYGGEEFVILLPGASLDSARAVAERVRRGVVRNVRTPDGKHVSVSIGCSEYIPGEPADPIVQRADKALYMAKESGRNCVRAG